MPHNLRQPELFSGEQTPVCGRIPGIPGKFMRIRCVENIGNRTAGQYIGRLLRQGARLGYLYHNLFFGIKIVKRFQAPSLFGASHRFTRFFISSPKSRFFRQPVCRPAIPERAGSRSPSARKIRKIHHGQMGAPSQWEGCARHPNRTPRATRKNKAQEGIGKRTSLGHKAAQLPNAKRGIKKGQTLRSDLEEAATYSPTGKPQYHRR